ncbi:MAG: helix-turn-helix domain-containing protein [Rhodococcus sp. (in: high G+C Gram-positive bacteria)]
MVSSSTRVADRVTAAIRASGASLREISQATGISLASLQRRCAGKREFKGTDIVVIADYLGVSAGSLAVDERPPEKR